MSGFYDLMTSSYVLFYGICFALTLGSALGLTPLARRLAIRWKIFDHPNSQVKTHKESTPYLGGLAIWAAFSVTLLFLRLITEFPTGTLYSLRGILLGSVFIAVVGLIDDIKPQGLRFKMKFLLEALAAAILINFDIRIKFIQPWYVADALTILWVVGVTNALNLIDIMDGLSASIATVASLSFLLIALPTEEIYVNFAAVSLAGACLGFLPYNLSQSQKIFMGDTGSLMLGFVLAALSLGTSYSTINEAGLFAPLLILAIPLFDTLFVMYIRYQKGKSPFLGSKDHFPLRLEALGYSRRQILRMAVAAATLFSLAAYGATRLPLAGAIVVLILIGAAALKAGIWLGKVKMD